MIIIYNITSNYLFLGLFLLLLLALLRESCHLLWGNSTHLNYSLLHLATINWGIKVICVLHYNIFMFNTYWESKGLWDQGTKIVNFLIPIRLFHGEHFPQFAWSLDDQEVERSECLSFPSRHERVQIYLEVEPTILWNLIRVSDMEGFFLNNLTRLSQIDVSFSLRGVGQGEFESPLLGERNIQLHYEELLN